MGNNCSCLGIGQQKASNVKGMQIISEISNDQIQQQDAILQRDLEINQLRKKQTKQLNQNRDHNIQQIQQKLFEETLQQQILSDNQNQQIVAIPESLQNSKQQYIQKQNIQQFDNNNHIKNDSPKEIKDQQTYIQQINSGDLNQNQTQNEFTINIINNSESSDSDDCPKLNPTLKRRQQDIIDQQIKQEIESQRAFSQNSINSNNQKESSQIEIIKSPYIVESFQEERLDTPIKLIIPDTRNKYRPQSNPTSILVQEAIGNNIQSNNEETKQQNSLEPDLLHQLTEQNQFKKETQQELSIDLKSKLINEAKNEGQDSPSIEQSSPTRKLGPTEQRPLQILPNGDIYIGEWRSSFMHGQGIYTFLNGNRYEGAMFKNKFQGKGKMFYINGDVYDGNFNDSSLQGFGIITYNSGAKYSGYFENNSYHGKGEERYPDNSSYIGEHRNGNKEGHGKLTFNDGSCYVGSFKDNLFNGQGLYEWADGKAYNGNFEKNKMAGKGILTLSNGIKYEGCFKDDKKHGEGVLTWPDGKTFQGTWFEGNIHGKGKFVYRNGTSQEFEWKYGVKIKNNQKLNENQIK